MYKHADLHRFVQKKVKAMHRIKDGDDYAESHWQLLVELGSLFAQELNHIAKSASLKKAEKRKFVDKCFRPLKKMVRP